MSCPRCAGAPGRQRDRRPAASPARAATGAGERGAWCKDCELLYDRWVRRHATDIVWQSLAGTVVIAFVGVGLPLLGVGWVVAAVGSASAFGTIYGLSRLTRRRRRRQFLQAPLPRAYLPVPK